MLPAPAVTTMRSGGVTGGVSAQIQTSAVSKSQSGHAAGHKCVSEGHHTTAQPLLPWGCLAPTALCTGEVSRDEQH